MLIAAIAALLLALMASINVLIEKNYRGGL